jgi:DNA uptake protein ComE-like DNA-binding protein
MPTPGERRALIFLASIAALGVGARGWKEWRAGTAPSLAGDRAGLARQIEAVDSAITAAGEGRRGSRGSRGSRTARDAASAGKGSPSSARASGSPAPVVEPPTPDRDVRAIYRLRRLHHDSLPAATQPVDLDVATAEQIASLPWIGRAQATRIVADRQAHGPFGSLEGLQRVPGIGPGTAARLQPFVTFSLTPRLGSTVERRPRTWVRRRPRG